MKISEIREILSASVLVDDPRDRTVLAAGGGDLADDVMKAVIREALLLTGHTGEQIMRTAITGKVGAVVYVRGKKPDDDVLELARSYNIPVLATKYSMFVASGRLYLHGLREIEGIW
mgnify:CR=1 FL=1